MNHIGDQEPDLIEIALPHLAALAPDDNVADWGEAQGVRSAIARYSDPRILAGYDLTLDWTTSGLKVKVCSFTPWSTPTLTEHKAYVRRETEHLSAWLVANLVADYRAAK